METDLDKSGINLGEVFCMVGGQESMPHARSVEEEGTTNSIQRFSLQWDRWDQQSTYSCIAKSLPSFGLCFWNSQTTAGLCQNTLLTHWVVGLGEEEVRARRNGEEWPQRAFGGQYGRERNGRCYGNKTNSIQKVKEKSIVFFYFWCKVSLFLSFSC